MASEARGINPGGSGARRLTAEHVAARVLLDATSIEEAASRILQAICESLGWEHGALWTVDVEGDCLRCAQIWSASPSRFPEFHAVSQGMTFRRGIGLPGRVWENRTPAWIPDVVADTNFPRALIAAREGLHAALGFPVLLRGEVFGVMEFFSREIREPDEHLLPMLTTVGNQIGLFIERRRAQDELSLLFWLSPDMLCIAGLDGYLKRVNPAWQKTFSGIPRPSCCRARTSELVHPDDVEVTRAQARKLFEGNRVVQFENRFYHKDGTARWLSWAAAPPQKDQQVVVRGGAGHYGTQGRRRTSRADFTNLELLDELLAALTDSGESARRVRADFGNCAKSAAARRARIAGVFADGRHAHRYASTGINPAHAAELEAMEIPAHFLRPDWEYDLLDDVTISPEPHNKLPASMGFRSMLRAPIRLDGRPAGFLTFLSKAPSAFNQTDILFARRIADRLAVTLARDREIAASKRADEATARAAQLEARVRALTEELDARTGYRRVVGNSPQWRQVLTQATQVASTETTVLLLGESGTGKEVVARFLHRGSPRSTARSSR